MAITNHDYTQRGVPTTLLGTHWKLWRIADLRLIINHYRDTMPGATLKINLMHELHLIIEEYGLEERDKDDILRARELGFPPPTRKARVGAGQAEVIEPSRKDGEEENTNQVANAEAGNTPACTICLEPLSPNTTPHRRPTFTCSHDVEACSVCLAQSITTQFADKIWTEIDCPCCAARMTAEDVMAFGDQDLITRYYSRPLLLLHC